MDVKVAVLIVVAIAALGLFVSMFPPEPAAPAEAPEAEPPAEPDLLSLDADDYLDDAEGFLNELDVHTIDAAVEGPPLDTDDYMDDAQELLDGLE